MAATIIKQSAGILVFRRKSGFTEVLLVHPGGPFFVKKDLGAWTIPKGEFITEDPLDAAIREFQEELGFPIAGKFIPLESIVQKGGKIVHAWMIEANPDLTGFKSNTFHMEWPAKRGKMQYFPEVDKASWFPLEKARQKINAAQTAFIDELENSLWA